MLYQLDIFGSAVPLEVQNASYETVSIDKKIDRALRLIISYAKYHNLALAYSGGKDSDVILRLAQLAHIKCDVVHNSTTIDPPGNLSYCAAHGATIVRPEYTFFQLVARKGLPSMFRRFYCSYLKERYIAPYLILGIRREESVKRTALYQEPTSCFRHTKKKTSEHIMPILDWTIENIMQFHNMENLTFNPHYYENGTFNPECRLGCIGCPLKGDRGRSDYMKYPKFLRQLARAYGIYVDNHEAVTSVYHDIVWQLFYSNHGDTRYQQTYDGLFGAPNPKEFLEDYFKIQLP